MSEKICNGCTSEENCENTNWDFEKEKDPVPYWTYKDTQARDQLVIKRLTIALIISVIINLLLPLGVHAGWLVYESLFDTISYNQDGSGINNVNLGEQGALYGTEGQAETEAE